VPALCEALRHESPRARAAAAFALRDPGNSPRDRPAEEERMVAPLLCGLVKDPEGEVRRNAVGTLTRLTWSNREARTQVLAAFRAALEDGDPAVRSQAASWLERRER
jgi:HEAT repeat protein